MGRWTAKGTTRQNSRAAVEALGSGTSGSEEQREHAKQSVSAVANVPSTQVVEEVADEAKLLLSASSLSEEQRQLWQKLCDAVDCATPSPLETKAGPPPQAVLAALQSARNDRDAFIACLAPSQKAEVEQMLELQKRARKMRSKGSSVVAKIDGPSDVAVSQATPDRNVIKNQQKEVLSRAFSLWQQDRQKETGSRCIDSTEWKRIRAIGGENPTLRSYLQRAGWQPSWPWPEPEGRLLRREGQTAAIAHYSRR
jgi:hypothetical protein